MNKITQNYPTKEVVTALKTDSYMIVGFSAPVIKNTLTAQQVESLIPTEYFGMNAFLLDVFYTKITNYGKAQLCWKEFSHIITVYLIVLLGGK